MLSHCIGRRFVRSAVCGDLAVPVYGPCSFCCGWSVNMEVFASVAVRPLTNSDILLSSTKDFSVLIRFISTLVVIIYH